ncbi:MAG: hydrolase, partial [Clostridiales bacterium]|nr:hydrolase [Clostridiales bacterium]
MKQNLIGKFKNPGKWKLPLIGMRILKSAFAVLICFIIYILRGNDGIPFYSAIAAILCMQPYIGTSLQAAKSRTIGTLIGGFWGFLIIFLDMEIHFTQIPLLHYAIVALMIIPVLYSTVLVKKQESSYITCVVFLSIVVEKVVEADAYIFVINRLLDTLIGIAVSIVINQIDIPRRKDKSTLFVSELDEVLLNEKNKMSDYSRVELNRMIKDGALFTIATERTVAATLE